MDKNYYQSPFFTINKDNKLLYLNKKIICTLPKEKESRMYILKNEGVIIPRYKKKKHDKTALVIEPHADDFALSALAYTLENVNVKVLNVFSKTSLKFFTWNDYITVTEKEYEDIRLEESTFAVEKVLGESFISLKEKSMRITDKNKKEIEKIIVNNIKSILEKDKRIDRILIPMGVGSHPDHLVVYESIINNIDLFKNYNIIIYPEYPYSRSKKIFHERIHEIEKEYTLNPMIVDISNKLNIITDIVSIYKSQFDDINRNQMLALIREDARAVAADYKTEFISLIYYEVGEKNED